jgi:hypothetical protein
MTLILKSFLLNVNDILMLLLHHPVASNASNKKGKRSNKYSSIGAHPPIEFASLLLELHRNQFVARIFVKNFVVQRRRARHHETNHNDSSEEEDATENGWFRSDEVSIIKILAFPCTCSIETRIERRIFRRDCHDGDSDIIRGTTFG